MKSTTDTYTGKRFRYNETVRYMGLNVPARMTKTSSTHLAPDRVPATLLATLNPTTPEHTMPLLTETNTPAVEKKVRSAAHTRLRIPAKLLLSFFEHGQWWVENALTGAQWSVADCQKDGVDYLDFEQITEGVE